MNEVKFIELQAKITALRSKLDSYQSQMQLFTQQLGSFAAEFPATLTALRDSIAPVATVMPDLEKNLAEHLKNVHRSVEQHRKRIGKDFHKPLLQYQSAIQKAKAALLKHLQQIEAEPKDAKFVPLSAALQQAQGINATLEGTIANALIQTHNVTEMLEKFALEVRGIDLPQELKQTNKQIEKLAESLNGLQLQLHAAPQHCNNYCKDFLFLSNSLKSLQEKSRAFTADTELVVVHQSSRANLPAPSVQP